MKTGDKIIEASVEKLTAEIIEILNKEDNFANAVIALINALRCALGSIPCEDCRKQAVRSAKRVIRSALTDVLATPVIPATTQSHHLH
jgi:hypothetical protein